MKVQTAWHRKSSPLNGICHRPTTQARISKTANGESFLNLLVTMQARIHAIAGSNYTRPGFLVDGVADFDSRMIPFQKE